MPSGGRLGVDVEPGAGEAVLRVVDSGVGMPPEVRERVFEPFFTTKAPGKGTGLGLATVYGIVDQAGGRIEIESEPGAGTEVTVRLPYASGGEEQAGAEPEGPSVLVVEDEAALRQLVRRVLETDGRRVIEARNGRDALAVLERYEGRVALMITDVVMPEMGGPELVQLATSRWPQLKVIYSSGYADSRLAGRGFDEAAVDLLRKPYTVDQLRERVARALT
jgi:CheY-like chemotaxis protein